MESLPRSYAIELYGVAESPSRPGGETLQALMRLEIAGLVAARKTLRSVYLMQPELFLEDARELLIGVDRFVRVMDLQRLRMNLVHRDVKMLVLLLAMAHRNVLVFL